MGHNFDRCITLKPKRRYDIIKGTTLLRRHCPSIPPQRRYDVLNNALSFFNVISTFHKLQQYATISQGRI